MPAEFRIIERQDIAPVDVRCQVADAVQDPHEVALGSRVPVRPRRQPVVVVTTRACRELQPHEREPAVIRDVRRQIERRRRAVVEPATLSRGRHDTVDQGGTGEHERGGPDRRQPVGKPFHLPRLDPEFPIGRPSSAASDQPMAGTDRSFDGTFCPAASTATMRYQ